MGVIEESSLVVSEEVVSECVTFIYGTLRYHGNPVHELGPLLEYAVPVDRNTPPRHVVSYIHNHSVSKTHLKNSKNFQSNVNNFRVDDRD